MLQKLYQKTRKGILTLPLIFGLAPATEALAQKAIYAEGSLFGSLFSGDNEITEDYLGSVGGSGLIGYKLNPNFMVGGRVSFSSAVGDRERKRSPFRESSRTQNLSIIEMGPFIEFGGHPMFVRAAVQHVASNDQIRNYDRSFLTEHDRRKSDRNNTLEYYLEFGGRGKIDENVFLNVSGGYSFGSDLPERVRASIGIGTEF